MYMPGVPHRHHLPEKNVNSSRFTRLGVAGTPQVRIQEKAEPANMRAQCSPMRQSRSAAAGSSGGCGGAASSRQAAGELEAEDSSRQALGFRF